MLGRGVKISKFTNNFCKSNTCESHSADYLFVNLLATRLYDIVIYIGYTARTFCFVIFAFGRQVHALATSLSRKTFAVPMICCIVTLLESGMVSYFNIFAFTRQSEYIDRTVAFPLFELFIGNIS